MHTTTIPDCFLMMKNAIARTTKTNIKKNSAHPITAKISVTDSPVAGAVKIPSTSK